MLDGYLLGHVAKPVLASCRVLPSIMSVVVCVARSEWKVMSRLPALARALWNCCPSVFVDMIPPDDLKAGKSTTSSLSKQHRSIWSRMAWINPAGRTLSAYWIGSSSVLAPQGPTSSAPLQTECRTCKSLWSRSMLRICRAPPLSSVRPLGSPTRCSACYLQAWPGKPTGPLRSDRLLLASFEQCGIPDRKGEPIVVQQSRTVGRVRDLLQD